MLAFAGALGCDGRITAHRQALIGELHGGDLREVLLVKERELQLA